MSLFAQHTPPLTDVLSTAAPRRPPATERSRTARLPPSTVPVGALARDQGVGDPGLQSGHRQDAASSTDVLAPATHRRPSPAEGPRGVTLPPSRVPVGAPARDLGAGDRGGQAGPEHYKSTTTATAGGLTGINLDVSFTVSGTPAAGLQIVQTFMGTRRSDGVQVGTYTWKTGGVDWDAFVDGGKNSPYVTIAGNAPAHATRPYYLTATEVTNQVTWNTDHGTIQTTDAPGAAALHDEAHFETAIVAIDAGSGHSDKVLKAFKWGWTGKGTKPDVAKGTKIAGADSGIEVSDAVSAGFKNIVKHDYPTYSFN